MVFYFITRDSISCMQDRKTFYSVDASETIVIYDAKTRAIQILCYSRSSRSRSQWTRMSSSSYK